MEQALCTGYRGIYQYYYDSAKEIAKTLPEGSKILKTDCHNETGIYPESIPLVPMLSEYGFVEVIEFDKSIISKVDIGKGNWNIQQGDIRQLPYNDNTFDFIIDCSTIDHIPIEDVGKVLLEYHRVAKNEAKVSIVVWLTESETTKIAEWNSTHQYFFNVNEFNALVSPETNKLLFRLPPNNTALLRHLTYTVRK
jgi:SAM-dependent methyltransferase